MDKKEYKDLLIIYRNYLFALEMRRLYNDKYGDTEEIIKMYEDYLEKNHIKIREK